ncbi:MAG: glycoside hydrolase [Verrucomicrobiales bacterium]|nr:glycoside hydrolase [Verrucomicrobiales bacterium]
MSRNCSIVLNAHVPWVRHPEVAHCLEEDWLHSAVLETHLPLLEMLFRLREEGVPYKLTLNLSPTFLAMLQDRSLKRRTIAYLDRTLRLCRDEVERGDITGFGKLAETYEDRFYKLRSLFIDDWHGDLVRAYINLRDSGHLELTASAATHGLLPLLMRVPESVQAQIRAGIRQYVQCFGRMPQGFWLPECAHVPSLSAMLKNEGIDWTLVEEHGMTDAHHSNEAFPFIPGMTPEGLIIFGRDQNSSSEIWSADEGYPGDSRYRDFMRDVGLDAPIEHLREYLDDSEQRQFTGLKYFRASRDNDESEPYDEELANKALEEHSVHFVSSRGAQLAALEANGTANPMIVCAFDADLFGHWWYEGTSFLERIFRKAAERGDFTFSNPSSYLTESDEQTLPTVTPVSSSWGEGGYFETWTSESNNWVHNETQRRAEQLARFVRLFEENRDDFTAEAIAHRQRCIQLMTKELLLAQSSDWAFLMNNEPSREYAEKRTRDHFANFDRIWVLTTKSSDDGEFDEVDPLNPIYSDLPWNLFEPYR